MYKGYLQGWDEPVPLSMTSHRNVWMINAHKKLEWMDEDTRPGRVL